MVDNLNVFCSHLRQVNSKNFSNHGGKYLSISGTIFKFTPNCQLSRIRLTGTFAKAKQKNTCVSGNPTDPKKIDRNCRPKTFYLHVKTKKQIFGQKWPKNRTQIK